MVLVAINYSDQPKSLKLDSKKLSVNKIFETTTDKNLEVSEWNGSQCDLKPRSILTITGKFISL